MRTKLTALLAALLILSAAATPALAVPPEITTEAQPVSPVLARGAETQAVEATEVAPTDVAVYVDGILTCIADPVFSDETNYVPFVTMCTALGADDVAWDPETGEYSAAADGLTISGRLADPYVTANGRCLYLEDGAVIREGTLLLPVRLLCAMFGAEVIWTGDAIFAVSTGTPIESGETFYDAEDLYWLSHIINAESGNQPLAGKIAVGNVVMNRVASAIFANTVRKVIFEPNQFSPARSGSVYRTPNAESVAAAKLVLEGIVVTEDSLFFVANRIAGNCWASRNRVQTMVIGGHTFFA